jgi:N-acetylneuraminic acid mutarotase
MKFKLNLLFLFTYQLSLAQFWQASTDFIGTARDDGASFVIQNKAYCGTGLQIGWSTTRDFFAMDLNNDSWTQVASLPIGKERQYACGFSDGNKGFIFGGVNSGTYLNDIWVYEPISNSWTEKTPLPSSGRSGAASFVLGNKAFILGGISADNVYSDEVWEYDLTTDNWTQKNNFPFGALFRASACSLNGVAYLLFGRNQNSQVSNQLYEYDLSTDNWSLKASFLLDGRTYGTLFPFGNHLVTLFGMNSSGELMNDAWSFDLSNNTWTELTSLSASGRRGGFCFNSSSEIYYTSGVDTINRTTATWKFSELFLSLNEKVKNPTITYNSEKKELIVSFSDPMKHFQLLDLKGSIILQEKNLNTTNTFDLSAYDTGIYILQIQSGKSSYNTKFLKL